MGERGRGRYVCTCGGAIELYRRLYARWFRCAVGLHVGERRGHIEMMAQCQEVMGDG